MANAFFAWSLTSSGMARGSGSYPVVPATKHQSPCTTARLYRTVFTKGEPEEITIRSAEHTSELQSLMRISYAVFCLKKKNKITNLQYTTSDQPHITMHKSHPN